ncbi:MAG TPA: DnaJ domain-containing protein [Pyrinomonadaceae bacterium]|jgi:curved DNA-binding protein CbpA
MNGQLSEQPLAELIREISANALAGRLQLQHERAKVAIYFDKGELLYAAANLRTLRLREYLLKAGIAPAALARYDEGRPDLELAKTLCADHILSPSTAEQIQNKQLSDLLRLALSWTEEGRWEFDPRSRLDEAPKLRIDTRSLLLEAGRHTPPKFAASRFQSPAESISPVSTPLISDNLLPTEVFLLSRLDRPTPLHELVAVSGLGEKETLVHIYTLALAGLLQRANWINVLGRHRGEVTKPAPAETAAPTEPPAAPVTPAAEKTEADDVETFLENLNDAQTHYDVLGVTKESSPAQMKTRYYELARRYHPDRFRKAEPSLVARLESAFARITQAYETLQDDRLRAGYDAKLQARLKAQQLADAAPKATAPPPTAAATTGKVSAAESTASIADRAEQQFKEGFAALELGEKKVAIGLFASAAKAMPNEARYHAFYGRMLAEHEQTRRAAEAEFQAAIKLDSGNSEYRAMLAELYRDLGLMLRARGEAERALAADPNNRKAKDLLRTLKSV